MTTSTDFSMTKDGLTSEGNEKANHLCVLIHGLWGSPAHLSYLARQIRQKHAEDKLHILVTRTNSDSLTYDGIDVGGERVTQELLDFVDHLERHGKRVEKLSIVGYSLGGLIGRYAIGLLESQKFFDKVKPENFTTFATPHLGARAPGNGWFARLYNRLGASTVAVSGQQMFLEDNFRDSGKPLLSALADPRNIFMQGLRRFPNRALYANVFFDRSVPYFTSCISRSDPFADAAKIKVNYRPDYTPNILDQEDPVQPLPQRDDISYWKRMQIRAQTMIKDVPSYAIMSMLLPIGITALFVNAGVQSIRSQRRVRLHEAGHAGILKGRFKLPLLVGTTDQTKEILEDVMDNMGTRTIAKTANSVQKRPNGAPREKTDHFDYHNDQKLQTPEFPDLSLTAEQFKMIDALDELGFKKIRVAIHFMRHTHAAIILRSDRFWLREGKQVIKHFLSEEFVI